MHKCLKCNSDLKESPHNLMTGYNSYRCSNKECNALFDESELSGIKMMKEGFPEWHDSAKQINKIMNSQRGIISMPQGTGKSNGLNHYAVAKKNKFIFLRTHFGDKMIDIAFDHQYQPRKVDGYRMYNMLSEGEKIIVDFLLHLYNPSLKKWPLSNLTKLDNNNKQKVLHIINNYSTYAF